MHQIKIINGSKETIADRFDGLLYTFAPGEKGVNMPLEAAKHIFGVDFPMDATQCADEDFRAQIFTHLQRRWGWNSPASKEDREKGKAHDKMGVGQRIFSKLSFVPVEMKTVELAVKNHDLPLPRGDKEDLEIESDGEEVA